MTTVARVFLLLGALASTACAAESEDVDADEGAVTAGSGPITPGVERQRAGMGNVAETLQRGVHFGNAHTLALISKESYMPSPTPESLAARGVPATTSVTSFNNRCTGGDAIFVESSTYAVLAFRGTEMSSNLDIEIDKDEAFHDFPLQRAGTSARVHNGFRRQFESLWNAAPDCGVSEGISAKLAAYRADRPLYFTGHSLGGALATLALAQTFVEGDLPPVAGVYTYGAPKVGDRLFAELVGDRAVASRTPVYRFVHGNDIVPATPRPLAWTESWQHVKPTGAMEHAFQVWFDAKSTRIGTMASFLGFSIPDHMLDGYVADLAANARRRGELR